MPTLEEVEKLAMGMTEKERAVLATHLLTSLPPVLADEDEGIAEALHREALIEAGESAPLSLGELDHLMAQRRTR
jgi:hypothetical protein